MQHLMAVCSSCMWGGLIYPACASISSIHNRCVQSHLLPSPIGMTLLKCTVTHNASNAPLTFHSVRIGMRQHWRSSTTSRKEAFDPHSAGIFTNYTPEDWRWPQTHKTTWEIIAPFNALACIGYCPSGAYMCIWLYNGSHWGWKRCPYLE